MRQSIHYRSTGSFLVMLFGAAALVGCSKDSTNCNNKRTSAACLPPPVAVASITISRGPQVVGDTTMGFAIASSTRGEALAQPTYNGKDIAKPGVPAPFEHVPAAGTAVYSARSIQKGATAQNAQDERFTIALIDATCTIDKTSITLGGSVQVTVPKQPGRDSVVVFEGGVRRARVLEDGGVVSITPAARGTTTITTTGFNGAVTQAGSTHTVTVQ
jgi:hypothetical protein